MFVLFVMTKDFGSLRRAVRTFVSTKVPKTPTQKERWLDWGYI